MSVKRITPLPAFSGVAAGQRAACDIPIGPRYHVIWLKILNAANQAYTAIVGDILLKVNGKTQRIATAFQINAFNTTMGTPFTAKLNLAAGQAGHYTLLPIFLAEPWRKQPSAADGLAWGTGNLSTFQIEVELLANVNVPSISAWAEVDNSLVKEGESGAEQQAPMGLIVKWYRQTVPVNGTNVEVRGLTKLDFYQQITFTETTEGNDVAVSEFEIQVENFTIRKSTKFVNDSVLTSREMTPTAKRLDIVFDHDDVLDSALPMSVAGRPVQDFAIVLTATDGTSRNLWCHTQRIGRPD